MYTLQKTEGAAKRGRLETPYGPIETPVFMNVATAAAIKGALSAEDLERINTQVTLVNTYHLHIRPGDGLVKAMGGVGKFMDWHGPTLSDSGGFQVFSLAALRKIKEEGVYFASHVDGRKIFMGPEESMAIQANLGTAIAMAFDECPPYPATEDYMRNSVNRTTRWLQRCIVAMEKEKMKEDAVNPKQMLFGINQGGTYTHMRIEHAKTISQLPLDGYAVGGLAVGETHSEMYRILEETVPYLPQNKPTYLMGVGTPENIIEGVARGIDFFDCVLPARNGRHGHVYTPDGKMNLMNARYEKDDTPIQEGCGCPACKRHTKGYIRHLFKAKEMLAMRLCVLHNLYYYNHLMADMRLALDEGRFGKFREDALLRMKAGKM